MNQDTQSDGATGWALRAATLSAAVTTGALGVQYWLGLDEPVMAGGTVIAEVVGVFGLAKAVRRLRAKPVSAVIGFVLVAMAAAWSGGTTWMKLDADARARAAAVALASPSYIDAQTSFAAASEALRLHLEQSPPACVCPATIAAWAQSHETQIELLERARADAEQRLRDASGSQRVRAWDVARAVFFEAVKLLGLFAFGSAAQHAPAPAGSDCKERKASLPSRASALLSGRWPWLVGLLGLGATAAQADIAVNLGAQLAREPQVQRESNKLRSDIVQPANKRALREAYTAQAREWALAGMPKTEVARRLGVHRNTVHNWLRLG
jgi:hypothetical protein